MVPVFDWIVLPLCISTAMDEARFCYWQLEIWVVCGSRDNLLVQHWLQSTSERMKWSLLLYLKSMVKLAMYLLTSRRMPFHFQKKNHSTSNSTSNYMVWCRKYLGNGLYQSQTVGVMTFSFYCTRCVCLYRLENQSNPFNFEDGRLNRLPKRFWNLCGIQTMQLHCMLGQQLLLQWFLMAKRVFQMILVSYFSAQHRRYHTKATNIVQTKIYCKIKLVTVAATFGRSCFLPRRKTSECFGPAARGRDLI